MSVVCLLWVAWFLFQLQLEGDVSVSEICS